VEVRGVSCFERSSPPFRGLSLVALNPGLRVRLPRAISFRPFGALECRSNYRVHGLLTGDRAVLLRWLKAEKITVKESSAVPATAKRR